MKQTKQKLNFLSRMPIFKPVAAKCAVSALLFFSQAAIGYESVDVLAPNSPYVPAVIYSVNGALPAPLMAKISETLSLSLQRSFLRALVEDMYGSDFVPDSAEKPGPPGPISQGMRSLTHFDSILRQIVATEFAKLAPQFPATGIGGNLPHANLTVELTWLPRRKDIQQLSQKVFQDSFGRAWSLWMSLPSDQLSIRASRVISSMVVASRQSLPENLRYGPMDPELYAWLGQSTENERWWPLLARFSMGASKDGMTVLLDAFVKPGRFFQTRKEDQGGMTVQNVSYIPRDNLYSEPGPGLVKISAERFYNLSGADPGPIGIDIRFGYMKTTGGFWEYIGNGFLKAVAAVPTIHLTLGPPETPDTPKQPTMRERFYNGFVTGVGLGPLLLTDWQKLYRQLEKKVEIEILFAKIHLNLADPNGPRIDEKLSSFPIVIDAGALGVEPQLLDKDTEIGGMRVYERVVGHQLTNGLTAKLRAAMQQADQQAQDALNKQFVFITDLFKQQRPAGSK